MFLAVFLAWNPAVVQVDALHEAALSWHIPRGEAAPRGARLLVDAVAPCGTVQAIVRSVVRVNSRLGTLDALALAQHTAAAAARNGIDPAFLAATLLQESAFDPGAISPAGAVGIGQFTIGTADVVGVDPWDPRAAIDATAALLARYVRTYRERYPDADPYALAAAAYNAGPDAVRHYGGVPPYAETRDYVVDIFWRWGRIASDATRRARPTHRTVFGY